MSRIKQDKWSYAFLKKKGIVQIDKTPPEGEPPDRPTAVRNGRHEISTAKRRLRGRIRR